MAVQRSRRGFLSDIGRGTLLAALGPACAIDLGLVSRAFAEQDDVTLGFGDLEPLVSMLQETPIERLQPVLADQLKSGVTLKRLTAAAALANARTFGGEDYIGFHTFMALAPALRMSSFMKPGEEALPVFKVLYRNTNRIHEFGGRESEVLRPLSAHSKVGDVSPDLLHTAMHQRETERAELLLSGLMSENPLSGLDALIPVVQENPEVHRTVLPYRAWDMLQIVGPEHALTLLRQSLRYCVKAQNAQHPEWTEHAKMLVSLLDEYHLHGKEPGTRVVDDAMLNHLSHALQTASPMDAARAVASALAEGFDPAGIGEALSLSASMLVLRDRGRLPQWEDRLKPAGSVHGDSVGVHGSDSANAWRHLAEVSTGLNRFSCLMIGGWQIARDRDNPGNLLDQPLPVKYHTDRQNGLDGPALLTRLDEAIRNNLQAHATAIVHSYGQLGLPAEPVFDMLLKYAVSEDGALHAEKYFYTVWDDFHATRVTARWQHLTALARVTASEYGKPAAGQQEARELLLK